MSVAKQDVPDLALSEDNDEGETLVSLIGENQNVEILSELSPKYSECMQSASFLQTLNHLFKSSIGLGILGFPYAMSKAGVLFGPIATICMLVPIIHCVFLLLQCAREHKKRTGKRVIGYAGTARYALLPYLRGRSSYAVYLVNFFIVSSQLGACAAYIVMASHTFFEISEGHFGDVRIWIVVVTALVLVPALLSRLDMVTILSGSANLLCIFGLASTMVYIMKNLKSPMMYPPVREIFQLPAFCATLLYSTKVITAVLPLENEAKDGRMFDLALVISTYSSLLLITVFGFLGYLAFGYELKGAITLNLPNTMFYNTVKAVYSLALLLTFFIQFHIAMGVMVPTIQKFVSSHRLKVLLGLIFRALLVVLTGVTAAVIPKVEDIIALIGAFTCSPLSLMFPPIIHLFTYWKPHGDSSALSWFSVAKDLAIFSLGFFLFVTGLHTTISNVFKG